MTSIKVKSVQTARKIQTEAIHMAGNWLLLHDHPCAHGPPCTAHGHMATY